LNDSVWFENEFKGIKRLEGNERWVLGDVKTWLENERFERTWSIWNFWKHVLKTNFKKLTGLNEDVNLQWLKAYG